jgi:PAS domain-containing protein
MPHPVRDGDQQRSKRIAAPRAGGGAAPSGEGEDAYRGIFQTLNDGLCLLEAEFDPELGETDFLILDANPAFERQFGGSDLSVRRWSETAPGLALSAERLSEVALGRAPAQFELQAAGTHRWHEVCAYSMGPPGSGRLAVLIKDVTDRKTAEVRLQESEERLRMALEASRMGTWRYHLAMAHSNGVRRSSSCSASRRMTHRRPASCSCRWSCPRTGRRSRSGPTT